MMLAGGEEADGNAELGPGGVTGPDAPVNTSGRVRVGQFTA